jgi:hypothetical protein
MNRVFSEDELNDKIDFYINTLILEKASDIAEKLTELECSVNNIECYNTVNVDGIDVYPFTDEAQDIFNIYYDEQISSLYELLNSQIKLI